MIRINGVNFNKIGEGGCRICFFCPTFTWNDPIYKCSDVVAVCNILIHCANKVCVPGEVADIVIVKYQPSVCRFTELELAVHTQ